MQSMEVEERPYAPPPHKRLGGPLRSFASGDLFTMILGAFCTAVICSVRPAPCPCRCLRYLLVVLPPALAGLGVGRRCNVQCSAGCPN